MVRRWFRFGLFDMCGELDELAAILGAQPGDELRPADTQGAQRRRGRPRGDFSLLLERLGDASDRRQQIGARFKVNAELVKCALEVRNRGQSVRASKRKQGGLSAQRADRIHGIAKRLRECTATKKLSDAACARWLMAQDAWFQTEYKLGTLRKDVAIARKLARSNRRNK